jgi:adenine deaminase
MNFEAVKSRAEAARGLKKAELVVKNGNIVNVFTKEVINADIAVDGGVIAGIGRYDGVEEIDAAGKTVCPGLIDGHVHIESSLVTPLEFAKAVLPHGTTAVVADPHEIANVCGKNGIRFMLDQARDLPLHTFFMAPSCVPGLGPAALREIAEWDESVIGLGEVMDCRAVIANDAEALNKLDLFRRCAIDGHAPQLAGGDLNAYAAAGIGTDHECSSAGEVLEKLRLGMYILIREGSAAKNLDDIVRGLLKEKIRLDRCVFCTDDKHLSEIREKGHIDYNVRRAIELGIDPIDAVSMATLNTASCYRLKGIGALAPGYAADFLILNDLHTFDIDRVYAGGRPVSGLREFYGRPNSIDPSVLNTVKTADIAPDALAIRLGGAKANVIQVIPRQIITKKAKAEVPQVGGVFIPDKRYAKLAVVERHRASGAVGLGIAEGFGISNGAIGSTVSHDAHNIIAAGDNDRDILLVVEALQKAGGGFVAASGGRITGLLELPVAGLMSAGKAEAVEEKLREVLLSAMDICGNRDMDPFMTLSFLALKDIPEIRLTENGLYDTAEARTIGLGE